MIKKKRKNVNENIFVIYFLLQFNIKCIKCIKYIKYFNILNILKY